MRARSKRDHRLDKRNKANKGEEEEQAPSFTSHRQNDAPLVLGDNESPSRRPNRASDSSRMTKQTPPASQHRPRRGAIGLGKRSSHLGEAPA